MRLGPRMWDGCGCRTPCRQGPVEAGRPVCCPSLSQSQEWGRGPRAKAGDVVGLQGGPPSWAQLGLHPPKPLLCSVPPTPVRCGGSSTCLGVMGRTQIPACPTADHWGQAWCGCRKPLILGPKKGHRHVWTWRRALPQVNFLPWSCIWKPLGQDCVGQLTVGVRGCGSVGPWAERIGWAKLREGGPIAASRAPASSLPGSIRDQTPSNAAQ